MNRETFKRLKEALMDRWAEMYRQSVHESPEVSFGELMSRQFNRMDKTVSEETVRRMLERYQKDVTVQDVLESQSPFP